MNSPSLPEHIAIIMDGNGRWAKARLRDRIFGHIKGARVAKKVIEYSLKKKIKAVTFYAFSEENWGRPEGEVAFLMRLLSRYASKERENMVKNNIRFRCIGQIEKLPPEVLGEVEKSIRATAHNRGLVITFALSYGGRQEITGVVRNIADLVAQGKLKPTDINEALISGLLQTAPLPDPDLLIRTSGEWRLSNFLPWQSVYTELYFTEVLWPEFTLADYDKALEFFCPKGETFWKTGSTPIPAPLCSFIPNPSL